MTCLRATPAYSRLCPDDRHSCTAHTTSYHVHVVCIPPLRARKIVLSCHPTSVSSKYPYSSVWPDESSFLLCMYGVVLCSSNVYTSIPCEQNRAIHLSKVNFFQNLACSFFGKFQNFFSESSFTSTLEIVFYPKLDT